MARIKPTSLTIHTYNVGFGDCYMLSFNYRSRSRHILIDFGMQRLPENRKKNHMLEVAKQIKRDCDGKLDVIVATHRHQDHISGFKTKKNGKGSGDIIASLDPECVVQPWTEHPDAPRDAKVAPSKEIRQAHANYLNSCHKVAESVSAQLHNLKGLDKGFIERLKFLGENNIKNKSAVKNLLKMAKRSKGAYVYTGSSSGFGRLLPGVKVHVLGPPTLVQTETIRDQVHKHSEEFWHLQSDMNQENISSEILFPEHKTSRRPAYARWFIHRMNLLRSEELYQIVRVLDDAMNNTSVILLFECGSKSFLFSGDAQWENWAYALDQDKYKKLLRNIDVYKVGHHGSLNATPKSLWKLFRQRGDQTKKGRLQTFLSTKKGVHGHEERNSEVPRRSLVEELKVKSTLTSTEDFGSELRKSINIKFT